MRGTVLLLALLSAAPARAQAFESTGEVRLAAGGRGASAAFDATRVVGPAVNLAQTAGGAWSGDLHGQNVALEVTDRRISAPNVELFVETAGGVTTVRGNLFGRRYSLEYGPKKLAGRAGACSVDLKRTRQGNLAGTTGCTGPRRQPTVTRTFVKLLGQARDPAPPYPQFVLALLAVLP